MRKRTKAIKFLGILLAFLVIIPVISIFIEFGTYLYQAFAGSDLARLEEVSKNLNHFFDFLFLRFVKDTFIVAFFVLVICYILGVSTAYLVSNYNFYLSKILENLLILPLAIPAYILAFVYVGIMDYGGEFQSIFGFRIDIFNIYGVIFVLSISLYPYVYLLAKSAFKSESMAIYEVGKIHGYSEFSIFFKVSIKIAMPSIIAGLMLVLMEVLSDYGASAYLGVDTFSAGIFKTWYDLGDPYSSSALSAILMFCVFGLMYVEYRERQKSKFSFNQDISDFIKKRDLSKFKSTMATLYCLIILFVGFILPLLWLGYWGLRDYKLFEIEFYMLSLNSLILAGVTGIITTILAFVLCFVARVSKDSKFSFWILKASSIGYAIPGAAIGVSLMIAAAFIGNIFGVAILGVSFSVLIFAYVVRFLATAIYSIDGGFAKIHSSIDEVGYMLRPSYFILMIKLYMPLLKQFFLLSFLVVFIDTIKELPLTRMLSPFSFETLSVKAFWYATDERIYDSALPSLMIVILSLFVLIFTHIFIKAKNAKD
ncbi:ABC transporter permease [Campylobacter porcelli]|uniref:Iron ABC transporter permease n=1 Tax=Campylobacter porcelli TaxID=1660073 RepID=A0ABU7M579_9BACT|nr:iron ABC transporter permease [Campylobacter sp. CX2-4855-23]